MVIRPGSHPVEMMSMKATLCLAILALALAPATAQWADNFDSYAPATVLNGPGGWAGWDNTAAAAGMVSANLARSAPHSIAVSGTTDAIHPWAAGTYTAGAWTLSAWIHIPAATFTADTYFIVNNVYNHGGPYNWAIEIQFDKATNRVLDDLRVEPIVPILFDQWVEIRIAIDLTANTQTTWYGCTQLSTGTWNIGGGILEIQNIDLFTTGGTCFYDDIFLTPNTGAWNLAVDQPSGSANLYFTNSGGAAGSQYFNAVSLVPGMPGGWFNGLAIPLADLVAEYLFGPPFSGNVNACGGAQTVIQGPIPANIPIELVSLNLVGGLPIAVTPAFGYVTTP